MGVELKTLIQHTEGYGIRLAAGKNGLSNNVSWAHICESAEAASFLTGEEIVMVTGIGLNRHSSLLELTELFLSRHVSAVLINIGPYIRELPDELVKFCNENDLPLFTVPWNAHLQDIIHTICFMISMSEQKSQELGSAFKNALLFPTQKELYYVALSKYGFQIESRYSVCLISVNNPYKPLEERAATLADDLGRALKFSWKGFSVFEYDGDILAIICAKNPEQVKTFANEIRTTIKQFLVKQETISMGVGKLTKSIRCLHKSYRQAKSILQLQISGKIPENRFIYSDMGLYRLLIGIDDPEILEDYYSQSLSCLVEYDREYHSNLLETLRAYLDNNCSVKETAEQLYVHRNTVNYKLGRIEEVTGLSLASTQTRLQLTLALMISDMITA